MFLVMVTGVAVTALTFFCVFHWWENGRVRLRNFYEKMPLFRCLPGLAKASDDYKAYANVKGHQRLLLPGYAKKHRHPQWRTDKEEWDAL